MKTIEVTVTRLIPGPVGEVYDVWLDPSSPGCPWHGANKIIANTVVDGLFYWAVGKKNAPGEVIAHYGRFVRLERSRLAEYTWMSPYTRGVESTVSVSFEARDGGTQITILHRGLPDDEAGRDHERGWTGLLESLASSRGMASSSSRAR